MKKLEFIIRREEPFENGDGHWDNEDMNTIAAEKLFHGVCTEMKIENDKITFIGGSKKVLSYDVIGEIEGHCYVRESEIKPGVYHEKWREPTDNEMDEFIELMKSVCKMENLNIKDDLIYNWYLSKKRNSKISDVLK